jgi:hypothetical protein
MLGLVIVSPAALLSVIVTITLSLGLFSLIRFNINVRSGTPPNLIATLSQLRSKNQHKETVNKHSKTNYYFATSVLRDQFLPL